MRQAEFIGHLAQTRSVTQAAHAVGMARETAYRLRARPGAAGFCAAWDAALGLRDGATPLPPKVTTAELKWRVDTGTWHVLMRAGRYIGVVQRPDNQSLFALLARCDRGGASSGGAKGHA